MNSAEGDLDPRLDDAAIERFSRQIILREVGGRGQRRLLARACRVSGDGVAAQVCIKYLIAAGVGRVEHFRDPTASATPIPLAWDPGAPAAADRPVGATPLVAWDLCIDATGGAPPIAPPKVPAPRPEARAAHPAPAARASLVLASHPDGALEIWLTAGGSELERTPRIEASGSAAIERGADIAEQAWAGSFLALIACHRLLDWPESAMPRRWRLDRGAAGWVEI